MHVPYFAVALISILYYVSNSRRGNRDDVVYLPIHVDVLLPRPRPSERVAMTQRNNTAERGLIEAFSLRGPLFFGSLITIINAFDNQT